MDTPTSHASRHPKFVRWALMLGIVVILNVFFSVLIALALPAPDYNTYCPFANQPTPQNASACDSANGVWTENQPAVSPDGQKTMPTGYCDVYTKCQQPYQDAADQRALYAFVVMIFLGILSLLAGLLPTGSSIVSTGLSYGGVVALIVGSASYWGTAGNWIRFAIALAGLLALLYIGWKRFQD